jgi:hypothetical protein
MAGKSICFSALHVKIRETERRGSSYDDDNLEAECEAFYKPYYASDEGEDDAVFGQSLQNQGCHSGWVTCNHRRMHSRVRGWKAKQARGGVLRSECPRAAEERRVNPVTWCPVLLFCI